MNGDYNHLDDSKWTLLLVGKTGWCKTVIAGPALQRFLQSIGGSERTLKQIIALHLAGTDWLPRRPLNAWRHFFGKAAL